MNITNQFKKAIEKDIHFQGLLNQYLSSTFLKHTPFKNERSYTECSENGYAFQVIFEYHYLIINFVFEKDHYSYCYYEKGIESKSLREYPYKNKSFESIVRERIAEIPIEENKSTIFDKKDRKVKIYNFLANIFIVYGVSLMIIYAALTFGFSIPLPPWCRTFVLINLLICFGLNGIFYWLKDRVFKAKK